MSKRWKDRKELKAKFLSKSLTFLILWNLSGRVGIPLVEVSLVDEWVDESDVSTVGLAEQKSTKFVKCVSLVDHFVISERGRKFWPTSSRSNLSLFVDQLVGKRSTIHADWAGRSKRSKFFLFGEFGRRKSVKVSFSLSRVKAVFISLICLFVCMFGVWEWPPELAWKVCHQTWDSFTLCQKKKATGFTLYTQEQEANFKKCDKLSHCQGAECLPPVRMKKQGFNWIFFKVCPGRRANQGPFCFFIYFLSL